MTARVLVSDKLSDEGIAAMQRGGLSVDVKPEIDPSELLSCIAQYDGLVVRSRTKVTSAVLEAGGSLKVVGRAGVGVDNIDLEAATKRGVVVMNTPGVSAITVAEHTFAMMLAMARHIPSATHSMKSGLWEKKRFRGRELSGKTLGVIGLGNIGQLVVTRARAFGMRVVAYDPFVNPDLAGRLGVELVELEQLWPQADVISLHVPLTERTSHLVNPDTLKLMKPGAFLVNCARGGVVDELALAEALASGHLGGAALDVFEKEPPSPEHPLFGLETFVAAPHLGASTQEAQDAVAVQLAEQVVAFLLDGTIKNALNVPSVSKELLEELGPWLTLARRIGEFAGQMAPKNPDNVTVTFSGDITAHSLTPVTNELLAGLLSHASADPVNAVNAGALAKERGLHVQHVKIDEHADYTSTVGVRVGARKDALEVVGTVFGRRDHRLVRVNAFEIDAVPEGHLLVLRNRDVPRIVGQVGTILGTAEINIGRIHLSRSEREGQAFSIINIDSPVPDHVLAELRQIPNLIAVTQLTL